MQSPDGVRAHQRGVLLAVAALVVTTAVALVIGTLLLVGCVAKVATAADGHAGGATATPAPNVAKK
ncbi:MAG TPA: hypothetical protein VIL36_08315 [Acidimicrobiales bacterium]